MVIFNDQQQTDAHYPPPVDMSFWVGMFLGGLLGAALIVLLGTDKGKKLAKQLQEEGFDFWDDTKDQLLSKKDEILEKATKIKGIITEKAEQVKEETEEQVRMKVEQLGETSTQLIKKGKELIETGKQLEQQAVAHLEEAKEKLSDQAIKAADQSLAHIEQLQERGRVSTQELRRRLFKNIPKKIS